MGGRTQDKDKIKEHTIFELRMKSNVKIQGSQHGYATANLKRIRDKMMKLFECLKQEVLTVDDLYENGLITAAQAKSFNERSAGWIVPEETDAKGGIIGQWLGEYFREIQIQDIIDGDYEVGDIEPEKRKELEEDFLLSGPGANGDKIDDRLKGDWFAMGRQYTVENPVDVTMAEIQQAKRVQNVWDIEGYMRAALYHHLRTEFIKRIWNEVINLNREYQHYCQILKISRLESDAHIISKAKLVGMTTTGLAKYRSMIAAVGPKIVLIEEAAEALEGPVVVACMPSVEHLILVGDHKQLRGHCSDINLSDDPYYLDISMFERLVTNELPYETLRIQRREFSYR
jgi:helicase required for RNAi-mediated heterochromatin assembly 1